MEKILINSKFREEIIVPLLAISPNFEYLMLPDPQKRGIKALMKDGVVAKIVSSETKTIFEFEDDIKRIYKVEPYVWLKKWYNACDGMITNLYLCDIYLKKH